MVKKHIVTTDIYSILIANDDVDECKCSDSRIENMMTIN